LSAAGCAAIVRELPDCKILVEPTADEVPDGMQPKAKLVLAAARFSPPIFYYEGTGRASVQRREPYTRTTPRSPEQRALAAGPWGACRDKAGALLLLPYCIAVAAATSNPPELVIPYGSQLIEPIQKINLNQSLLKHIQIYAQDSGAGHLGELPDQGPTSLHDKPRYRGEGDYVLEISITERGIRSERSLRVSARGRLIRLADNVLIREFTTTETTDYFSKEKWTEENGKLVYDELGAVLQRIARTSVDHWIKTATNGEHDATVVIASSCGSSRGCHVSFDGCKLGSLGNDLLTIRSSAGKHILRVEGWSAGTVPLDLQSRKTRFFRFELLYSYVSSLREIDRSEAVSHCLKFEPCRAKMQSTSKYWFP
jgi:hypothetical protein